MVVTWEEALAEREAEGKAEGRIEAVRENIVLTADVRHGSTPSDFRQRLEAIDDFDRLQGILEQVIKARSLDDVDFDS